MADEPAPDPYAALGFVGAAGNPQCGRTSVLDPMNRYGLDLGAKRVWSIDASTRIGGHGKICNESVYWALYNQLVTSEYTPETSDPRAHRRSKSEAR